MYIRSFEPTRPHSKDIFYSNLAQISAWKDIKNGFLSAHFELFSIQFLFEFNLFLLPDIQFFVPVPPVERELRRSIWNISGIRYLKYFYCRRSWNNLYFIFIASAKPEFRPYVQKCLLGFAISFQVTTGKYFFQGTHDWLVCVLVG